MIFLECISECEKTLQELKMQLLQAPVLGLQNLAKLFDLYIHKIKGIIFGVSAQKLGTPYSGSCWCF